jgi:hypothetical protein
VQLGLGAGTFDTTIRFEGDRDVDVEMSSVSVSGAWLVNDRWSVRAAGGILLDGKLDPGHGLTHDVDSGGLVAVGGEYRALVGDGGVPYVDLSLSLGWSWAKTMASGTEDQTDYSAFDTRLGGRAGWLIGERFFPYGAVRIFGGPVNWELDGENVTGSDIYHYQIALGASLQLGPVGIYAEWAGLGEKAISAGLSTAW